jgi:hypothetical protein
VTVLTSPPASVAAGGLESDTTAYAFFENQLGLTSPLDVDISTPGKYNTVASLSPGTIDAGTLIDSYLVESDPATLPPGPDNYRTYAGSITFDTPILGIIVETANLRSTDPLLGASGTIYPASSDTFSGLDLNTSGCSGSTCGNDGLILSADQRSIEFGFVTNFSEDQIRIITAAAVPEPAGAAFVFLGLLPILVKKAHSYRNKSRKQI